MASDSKSRRAANPAKKQAAAAHKRHGGGLLNMDSEQSMRLLLISAVVGIIAIAMGFIAFGYWYSVVKPRNRTVLEVEGIKVSYSAMKRRMLYEIIQNSSYQQVPGALAEGAYLTVLDELTVISRAESDLGVTATQDELDQKLRARVGVDSAADQKTFANALRRQLETTGLNETEYRRLVRAELLTQKIKDKFKLEVPVSASQAKVEVIALNTEDDANKAVQRVQAGEDWATVAKEMSAETSAQTTGGVHDYAPQGTFDPTYDTYAFSADVGAISPPLSSPGGQFFIVRVVDRADKPVTEEQKPTLTEKAYNDWLSSQQDQMSIKRDFDKAAQTAATNSVLADAVPRLKQQQQQVPVQPQQVPVQPQQQAPSDQQPPVDQQPPPADSGDQGGQDQQAPGAPVPAGGNGQ